MRRGAQFPGRQITTEAPKSPNNVRSTFFNTVNLLPKELRFEHGGAKLASCPRRHLTSLRPWYHIDKIPPIRCDLFPLSGELDYYALRYHVFEPWLERCKYIGIDCWQWNIRNISIGSKNSHRLSFSPHRFVPHKCSFWREDSTHNAIRYDHKLDRFFNTIIECLKNNKKSLG